ncbi:MAG: dihydropteroate synthase [Asgard group archaeon]|nr:dihydropteroate synthase [Asgard group archaeon]
MKEVTIRDLTIGRGQSVKIMGVINLSPESFYKGSIKKSREQLITTVETMEKAGADIIDIGAMSTAPYLETQISPEEEIKRITETISIIKENSKVPISIDTTRATTAKVGLENKADLINDISGFTTDPQMPRIIAKAKKPIIIGAYKLERFKGHPIERINQSFEESLTLAKKAGISKKQIILDPDIGFHRKTSLPWYQVDACILKKLRKFIEKFQKPICIGLSRKSFIGHYLDLKDPEERLFGSLGATCLAFLNGANIIRTHDVEETKQTITIIEKILQEKNC